MAKDFDLVYPPEGRVTLDGGLNTKYDKYLIADNEISSGANLIYTGNGLETRGGTSKFNSTSVGTYACDGLFTRHDRSGSETMVCFFRGLMYYGGANTFVTVPSAQSVFTAGVDVAAEEYENYLFVGNGTTPYKYNGDFTRHGIPAPTTAPTSVSGGTGVLSGQYRYKFTYVNSGLVEGDVSPANATFTASANQIQVTFDTAPASFGVIYRNIYRTTDNGSTWLRVAQITNNTATTFVDNIADGSLGATAPTDQGEPPNYSVIKYHKDRLFTNDTGNLNYIAYSELLNPYVFKANNFVTVGDNTGDLVRAIEIFDDAVYALCARSFWLVYMPDTDPTTWVKMRIKSPYGTQSPFASWLYNNKVGFAAMQNGLLVGFGDIAGGNVTPSATLLTTNGVLSDRITDRIEPDIFNINETYVGKINAIVFKNKAYISVTDGSNATSNNKIWVYDFSKNRLNKQQEGSWIPWTGLNAARFTIFNDKLYYGSADAVGLVYEMNTQTYSDNGTAINSYVWTKEFQGLKGEEEYSKDFRTLNMILERSGDYNVEVRYKTDTDQGAGNQALINVDAGGTNWGFMWGEADWSAGFSDLEKKIYLGTSRGKSIQFKFSNLNTLNQKFKIIGFKFGYNRKSRR